MKLQKMDHVSINVNDLPAAKAFFVDLGLEVQGEWDAEGPWLDHLLGLTNIKTSAVMMRTSDGGASIELVKYHSPAEQSGAQPPLANAPGLIHIAFTVDDIESIVANLKKKGSEFFSEIQTYEDIYKLCYVRGPAGIIIELAEELK